MNSVNLWKNKILDFILLGGVSILILPLMYCIFPPGREFSQGIQRSFLAIVLILDFTVNYPHFSFSFQIFYKNFLKKLRRKTEESLQLSYFFNGVIIPLLLITLFAISLVKNDIILLSSVVNIRLLTFGWHYAMQGYGILAFTTKISNYPLTTVERLCIKINTHFSWIYFWIFFNSEEKTGRYFGIDFFSLALPKIFEKISIVFVILSTTIVTIIFLKKFFFEKRIPPFNGLLAYIASVYIWIGFRFALGDGRNLELAYILTPFFHSLQYFTMVHKYKINEFEKIRSPGYLKFILIGFAGGTIAFVVLPLVLKSILPYYTSLYGENFFKFIIWSYINIHHFFIDSVIWKKGSLASSHLYKS